MCPKVYDVNGHQCVPIKVEIKHGYNISYRCHGWNLEHTYNGPTVNSPECENCSLVSSESKVEGTQKTTKYVFALTADAESGCNTSGHGQTCKIKFTVNCATREWNSGVDYPEPQSPPFTTYDGGNPYDEITVKATRGEAEDEDTVVFGEAVNPNPSSDFSVPDEKYTVTIEVLSEDEIKVEFEQEI